MSAAAPDWPASAFWAFSLELYARPGVAAACLALQDRHGLDVNLVLLAGWAAHTGRWLDPALASRLRRTGEAYQTTVMQPLREARRGLKAHAAGSAFAALADDRRRALLALELDLERLEQLQLEALLAAEAGAAGSHQPPSFAAALAALYPDRDLPAPLLATVAEALAGRSVVERSSP